MPRYKLTIEYDGSPYVGWQRQINGWSVQGAIEAATLELAGNPITLFGAGRTDTGVHAVAQIGHFDMTKTLPSRTIMDAINARLRIASERVSILACEEVPETFDSRFSATARHYRYLIFNRRAHLTFDENRCWWVRKPLNVEAMDAAAKLLLGTHDFTTFRSTDCQAKSPVRTLDRLDVRQVETMQSELFAQAGEMIEITASARSFLHNQVRSMVGSLKMVGDGRWNNDSLIAALEARDRKACGPVAPPQGLYLMQVDY
jgi:tRNA pseudouridine38-40 synthase